MSNIVYIKILATIFQLVIAMITCWVAIEETRDYINHIKSTPKENRFLDMDMANILWGIAFFSAITIWMLWV